MKHKTLHLLLLISMTAILIFSGLNPYDRFTWFLEVLPVIIGGVVLVVTYPKFKFSNLVYIFIWIQGLILIVGGHYTYAEMPLFNTLRDNLGLARNYYDRLGHFAQGFIPALVIREVIIKKTIVKGKVWINFITIGLCLAFSAFYELIEFAVALTTGTAAEAFLGTQGDIWDTQWDMFFALIGSMIAILTLGKYHNRVLFKR